MRKLITAFLSATFAVAGSAQGVLQCVNPDVVNGLVFNGRPEARFSIRPTIPDNLEGFEAPRTFVLIGTANYEQNPSNVFVGYRVDAPAIPAFQAWVSFLGERGWKRETQPMPQQQPMAAGQAAVGRLATRLCRDGERRNLLVQVVDSTFYATASVIETFPPRPCGVPEILQQPNTDFTGSINAVRAMMPQFTYPTTARMSGGPGPGGNVGSNTVWDSARIESPDSAASLLEKLGRQLATQGWSSDADWKGKRSAGSTWTRKGGDGKSYWGTLEILDLEKNLHEIGFTVAMQGVD